MLNPCNVIASALFLPAVLASAPQTPPVLRSGIDLVTVDVTVLKRTGEPLTELGPDDFTVTVDGAPRRIVALRLVREAGEGGAAVSEGDAARTTTGPPERPAGRLFVLVVDRDHIAAGEGQQMLEAAARFVDALPAPDRVAIWAIPPARSGLQFSSDREAAKRELRLAVGTYRPPMLGGVPGRGQFNIGRDEAIEVVDNGRREVLAQIVARECPAKAEVHTQCPDEVETAVRTVVNDSRQRAQVTLTSLDSLVRSLAVVQGPKNLVLLTGGPLNTREEQVLIRGIAAQAAAARVTIHALQVLELAQARATQMTPTLAQIDQTLSAAYFLAGSTGGLATTPVSGDIGFRQLSRELSAGYELAFETVASDRDGALHRVEVQVRDRGWGSVVRARRSFRIEPSTAPATARASAEPPPSPANTAAPAQPPATVPEPLGAEVGELTTRLAAYVEQFEREFSAVVAEERYVQIVHPWRGNPKGPDSEPMLAWQEGEGSRKGGPIIARRQILSDILMVQSRDQQWVAFRDVSTVDGKQIRDRSDRVRDLFLSQGPNRLAQLREITEESARYNLGNVRRTLNIPTLTLSFMRGGDQWRYQFRRLRDEAIGDRTFRVLSFVEKARPTLIGTPNSGDIPIEGRIWMDAQNGRVARTELRFDRGSERRVLIRVEYRTEPATNVLVPASMWEWYEGADQFGRIGGDKTLVQGLATYANLRRFQVSTSEEIKDR
jgi:VWFA-related protein